VTAYIVRRLGWALILILGVDALTFLMTVLVPTDPARVILGIHATKQAVAALRRDLGLNLPVYVQFGRFLWRGLHGNLGYSYALDEPVGGLIAAAWPRTAVLALCSVACELLIGVPLGILLAGARRPAVAAVLENLTMVGMSVPLFWVASMLLYLFAFRFGWFPLGGYSAGGVVLPAVAIGITGSAVYARLLSVTLAEVRTSDHVRTARAKGLSEQRVMLRHVVRVGLLPFITQLGSDLGNLMGGIVVLESVFSIVGLGNLAYSAISVSDIPVIEAVTLVTAAVIILLNLVVDIAYAALDPRIVYT
jgi:peptide/nickel transport system permease protein